MSHRVSFEIKVCKGVCPQYVCLEVFEAVSARLCVCVCLSFPEPQDVPAHLRVFQDLQVRLHLHTWGSGARGVSGSC